MWQNARCHLRHLVKLSSSCKQGQQSSAIRGVRRFSRSLNDMPLRILFCGSDDFSITSLRALYAYAKTPGSNVASIDVATKRDKRTGRGLKTITPPVIKPVAKELGLPLHQFDTFTGWMLPYYGAGITHSINLVVAVSFGLLVPPRILKACAYGGINVHPSLLPDLKGSTPIEHAILYGDTQIGVTVQTLHPSKFDEGSILEQTPSPGIAIPNPDSITAKGLKEILAPVGAEMLVKAIHNRRYLPGSHVLPSHEPRHIRPAPKLLPENREVSFSSLDVEQILRMNRAIPKLWAQACDSAEAQGTTRILFGTSIRRAQRADFGGIWESTRPQITPGTAFAIIAKSDDIRNTKAPLLVATKQGTIAVPELTVSGSMEGPAAKSAAKAALFKRPVDLDSHLLYVFHAPFGMKNPPNT